MATHTSTVPAVLDALKALLDARDTEAMAGVVVTTAPSGEPVPKESIQFFGTAGDQAWGALGNRRRTEGYTVAGAILVQQRGAGRAVWDAVRNRAYELLAELEDALRTNPTLDLPDRVVVQLATANLDQGLDPEGRIADIAFTLGVTAQLVSN